MEKVMNKNKYIFFVLILLFNLNILLSEKSIYGNNSNKRKNNHTDVDNENDDIYEAIITIGGPYEKENAWDIIKETFKKKKNSRRFLIKELSKFAENNNLMMLRVIPFFIEVLTSKEELKDNPARERALYCIKKCIRKDKRIKKYIIKALRDKERRERVLDMIIEGGILSMIPDLRKMEEKEKNKEWKKKIKETIETLRNKKELKRKQRFLKYIRDLGHPEIREKSYALLFFSPDNSKKWYRTKEERDRGKKALIEAYKKEENSKALLKITNF